MDYATALAIVHELSVEDRIRLVQDVWDGLLDEQVAFELTEEEKRELDRRLAEHDADPDSAVPWQVVLEGIEERLRGVRKA